MIGKIKTLVFAVVAISALGAVGASAAQADSFIDLGAQPAVLTGHSDANAGGGFQTHTFTLTGKVINVQVICPTASFEGTTQGQKINDVTVTARYGTSADEKGDDTVSQGCQTFGSPAQVLMNGCKYTLTGAGQPANTALVDIVGCTTGKKIEIISTMTGCIFDIGEQNGLPHVFSKNDSAQEITTEATISGATKIVTQQTVLPKGVCPDGNNFQAANGDFAGNTTVKAFQDSGAHQVKIHNHQYNQFTVGGQVSLQTT